MTWRLVGEGANKSRLNKENIPSRAYISFKDEEHLARFSREYDGHLFRDKAGALHVDRFLAVPLTLLW